MMKSKVEVCVGSRISAVIGYRLGFWALRGLSFEFQTRLKLYLKVVFAVSDQA
jgi:hypothetical protein